MSTAGISGAGPDLDDRTYARYDGFWREIHHDYVGNTTHRVKDLFDYRAEDLRSSGWASEDDEDAYSKALAELHYVLAASG